MAKKAAMPDFEKDDVANEPAAVATAAPDIPPPALDLPTVEMPVRMNLVEVPLCDVAESAYRPRHVDVHLNHHQADALKKLMAALDAGGYRLANGHRIRTDNIGDAIRWLLEKVAHG